MTKRPIDSDQTIISAGGGTADYLRGTVDINKMLNNDVAVRLNGMVHRNDVPGRKVEDYKRWGVLPEITFGMAGPTRLTLEYFHQHDRNIPQYGIPYYASAAYTGPLPGVDRSDYYGFRNIDTQKINVNQLTAIVDHDFTDKITLRNLTRYEQVTQFTIADGPEGLFCLPRGVTATGLPCVSGTGATAVTVPAGFFFPTGGSRGNTRDTRNRLYYNQTDLRATVKTGWIEHTLDFGFSISRETYRVASGNSERALNGTIPAIPNYPIYNPDAANFYNGPVNFLVSARSHNRVDNQSVYLFDVMKLSPKFEFNAGVRYENNKGRGQSNAIIIVAGPTFGNVTANPVLLNHDHLFSYRAGLVFKPVENASLYIAYGNSKTPSQSTVNGSCTSAATAAIPSATCNTKPEDAKNYEIGGKVELFDGGLLLNAALFRNERDSFKVASGDPTVPDQQTDGRSRVDGLALGASGHITPALSITANYTYLKSKLIQSVSNKCLAAPGTGNCTNTMAVPNPGGGSPLVSTPKHSGSIYTAYTFPFGLTLGYGATYQGRFVINTPTAAVPQVFYSRSYLVHNATITYDINKKFQAQVNVKNIGDKLYYTRIRTAANAWAAPGDARSAVLTLTYKL